MESPAMRATAETIAAAAVAGAFVKLLPAFAAAFGILWYCVCLWESPVGHRWRSRWKRLFTKGAALSIEDKIMFLFLVLAGSGLVAAMVAVRRLVVP